MNARIGAIAAVALALTVVTVVIFRAFDMDSHSASDTLRPFVLTVAPLWLAALWAARRLLSRPR
jgi:hypothetical protein